MHVPYINTWPDNCNIQYGDKNFRRLSAKCQTDEILTVRGLREFKTQKISQQFVHLNHCL